MRQLRGSRITPLSNRGSESFTTKMGLAPNWRWLCADLSKAGKRRSMIRKLPNSEQRQWEALARDLSAEVPSLEAIVADLAAFLMPQARQALQRTSGRLRTEIRRHPTQLNKTNKLTHPKSKQPYRKWPFSHSPGPSSRLRCWLLSVTKTPCSNSCEQAIITRRMYQTACSSERLTYWRTNPAASNVSNNH